MSTTALNTAAPTALTEADWQKLAGEKVFFGHQSVGRNIVQGMKELAAAADAREFKVMTSTEPETVPGGAFIEASIGENGDPASKNAAFTAIIERGLGEAGGIAMLKYCYLDIGARTDARQVFDEYKATVDALQKKYPNLRIVHITQPLTTIESSPSAFVRAALGRATRREANARRNTFNELLRAQYPGTVFDLARVESTRADGTRSAFASGSRVVYTLAHDWTTDGGHLNEAGRRVAAEQLLVFLARL